MNEQNSLEMEVLRRQLKILEDGQAEIKKETGQISNQVGKIDDDVKEIMIAISGNTFIGITGIVKRIESLETFKTNQEKIMNKVIGGGIVVGVIWTLLLKFFDKIFA